MSKLNYKMWKNTLKRQKDRKSKSSPILILFSSDPYEIFCVLFTNKFDLALIVCEI
jgi:hypothetical protein